MTSTTYTTIRENLDRANRLEREADRLRQTALAQTTLPKTFVFGALQAVLGTDVKAGQAVYKPHTNRWLWVTYANDGDLRFMQSDGGESGATHDLRDTVQVVSYQVFTKEDFLAKAASFR